MAHLEIIKDSLHSTPYMQNLAYLKQGELSELDWQGSGGAAFAVNNSFRYASTRLLCITIE